MAVPVNEDILFHPSVFEITICCPFAGCPHGDVYICLTVSYFSQCCKLGYM